MTYVWKAIKCAGAKPLARSSHSVDAIGQAVYVLGGEHEPRVPISSAVWRLDTQLKTWTELKTSGEAPPSRNAHSSATVGSCIYVFGGRQGIAMGEGSLADMYKLDTDTATWTKITMTGSVPQARSYHTMTAIGNTLYVFGGCAEAGRLNDFHAFNTETGVWQSLPTSADISGRGGAGFAAVGARLYVVGGFAGQEMGDVHEFDTTSSQWRQLQVTPSLPARSVFGVAALGKEIVVIGGEVDPSSLGHAGAGQFSDEVYVLDTEKEERGWQKMVPQGEEGMSARGWFSASAFAEDSAVLFGGNSLDNSRLDDAFILQKVPE